MTDLTHATWQEISDEVVRRRGEWPEPGWPHEFMQITDAIRKLEKLENSPEYKNAKARRELESKVQYQQPQPPDEKKRF